MANVPTRPASLYPPTFMIPSEYSAVGTSQRAYINTDMPLPTTDCTVLYRANRRVRSS